ncbi:TIGR03364 family FAD-dependent oxidoreductase [Kitasatospora sp. NBC_00240]|uniref:TIGR03364 family FAD-dependent oxidoreductase n=1 Tax=Kitasatospora sp. NBC_00240 TaxID=2903567 RepID=UPI00225B0C61|nr:TIGR03364 family FAD-dependent oxidoreductase [Kitasatospora sp. NBC_00240]MCX5207822.1 TIGR03364 family FAD-dependent oxidoreductase [Kitasatospora sp. NBC_00240]
MPTQQVDTAVVGGGIVGLAHALAAARRGDRVVLFERDDYAVGASIRNFGLVWPVGQQPGAVYRRALRAREIWLEVAASTDLWAPRTGSLHLAHVADEQAVLEEFLATVPAAVEQGCRMVSAEEAARLSPAVRSEGLLSALWSPTELNVDPRRAIPTVARLLAEQYGVDVRFGTTVRGLDLPTIDTTAGTWRAERVFVCSGNDFETLYPEAFAETGLTRCKLQMLRTAAQPGGWQLGATLCGGLTLLHYAAFKHCASLGALLERAQEELPFCRENGIHVLLSQTADGALTIGDSHEYARTHHPFERESVNRAIMDYLVSFAQAPDLRIAERWTGVYPSLPGGATELVVRPQPGVTVVNGLGGAGMTLSFGLAEEVVSGTYVRP